MNNSRLGMNAATSRRPAPGKSPITQASSVVAGFSLVEALIAMALLLTITVGVLPFFTQSIINNVQGGQATTITNLARSSVEELNQLAFDSPLLTLAGGNTELLTTAFYSPSKDVWIDAADWDGSETPPYTRTVRVRQFSLSALDDNLEFDDNESLPGGIGPGLVHLKEIQVVVETPDQIGVFGPQRRITLRTYKPF